MGTTLKGLPETLNGGRPIILERSSLGTPRRNENTELKPPIFVRNDLAINFAQRDGGGGDGNGNDDHRYLLFPYLLFCLNLLIFRIFKSTSLNINKHNMRVCFLNLEIILNY